MGLVMVQVISNLGGSARGFGAGTVVRPLGVSVGLAVAVPLLCRFIALPLTCFLNGMRTESPGGVVDKICRGTYTAFVVHTLIMFGLVTGATYAGTSNLFAAYLAGASVSWWDTEVPHIETVSRKTSSPVTQQDTSVTIEPTVVSPAQDQASRSSEGTGTLTSPPFHGPVATTGDEVFDRYYKTPLQRILKPFFFVSYFPI